MYSVSNVNETSCVLCECKLLPLCLSVGGSRSCVYAGFTRCWFNHWTDDRLRQQLRRQIHSPTLSRLPPRLFSPCFVYMYLSLSRSLFLPRTTSMFWRFLCPQTDSHSLTASCVWLPITHNWLPHCNIANYNLKNVVNWGKSAVDVVYEAV